jgi:hypothetical protein
MRLIHWEPRGGRSSDDELRSLFENPYQCPLRELTKLSVGKVIKTVLDLKKEVKA